MRGEGEDYADGFSARFTRSFFTERGDLVIELRAVNGTSAELEFIGIAFEVTTDKVSFAPRFLTKTLAVGAERFYTLVIPAESLQGSMDILNLSASFFS